ncbi:MAG TPA: tetratricopeptide repeat protein, partial [Candidatus Binatia bacterium]|nr:tetratricopeptide repeat protein [Candidatus Binatia bacterium]
IRALGPAELHWMLTTFQLGHWQPLSWLTLALDYRVWGLDASGYHLTSLLLHVLNAVLLFALARRLLDRAGLDERRALAGAALGALLWSVHPLRVESVAWVTERRDVLATFFTLVALLAYTRGSIPATLAAAVFAVLAKASAMVIPVFLVILDVYPLRRLGGARGWTVRRVWLEKVPFFALAIAAAVVAAAAQRSAGALRPLAEVTLAHRAGAAMYGLGFYLWKTIVPRRLLPMYEYPLGMSPLYPLALAGVATAVVVAVAAIALRRRAPGIAAAFVAYLAAIAPTLGLAQAGPQVVADRYAYLSTIGWSIVAGGLAVAGTTMQRARAVAAAVAIVVLAVLTARQTTTWHDPVMLWSRVAALEPTNAFALKSLGDAARVAGDADGAIRWYERALALRPYADAEMNLAAVLAQRGRVDDAVAHYRAAIRADPGYAFAYTSYGVLEADRGHLDEAIAAHRRALAIDPNLMEAHANLAAALEDLGRDDEAKREYAEALRLRPSAEVYNNLGLLALKEQRADEAVAMFRRAVALRADIPVVYQNLARALTAAGDRDGAAAALETALRLDPNLAGARAMLDGLRAAAQ